MTSQEIRNKSARLSLSFLLIALFLVPLEMFDLNPVATEVLAGRLRSINIGPPDILLFASVFFFLFEGRSFGIHRKLPNAAFGAFLLLGLLSTLIAEEPFESFKQIVQYGYLLFFFVPYIVLLLDDEEKVRWGATAMACGIAVNLLISAWLLKTAGRIGETLEVSAKESAEFYGVGGLTRAAMTGTCMFLVLFKFLLAKKNWRWALISGALGVLSFAMGMLSYNRSTIGALVLGLILVILIPLKKSISISSIVLKGAIILGLMILLLFKFSQLFLPEIIHSMFTTVFTSPLEDVTFQARYETIAAVLRSWPDTLFLGWGLDPINIVSEIEQYIKNPTINSLPHNVYFNWWAGAGFFGLIAMLCAIWRCFLLGWNGLRSSKVNSIERTLLVGFLSSYATLLANYMLHASVYRRIDWAIMAMIFAISLSILRRPLKRQELSVKSGEERMI